MDDIHAYAFASFLRRVPLEWRQRRTDTFEPRDIHLAAREVSLQISISDDLVGRFESEYSELLAGQVITRDEPISAAIPFAQLPKRLLLNLRFVDEGNKILSLLPRSVDAKIETLYLTELITANADPTDYVPDDAALERMGEVLYLLAYQNPYELQERVSSWMRFESPTSHSETIREWLKYEVSDRGDVFASSLVNALETIIEKAGEVNESPDHLLSITEDSLLRIEGGFSDLVSLALFGVRDCFEIDSVRNALDRQSRHPGEPVPLDERAWGERVGVAIRTMLLEGLGELERVLTHTSSADSRLSIMESIGSSVAHVACNITLGKACVIRMSDELPVQVPIPTWRSSWEQGRVRSRVLRVPWLGTWAVCNGLVRGEQRWRLVRHTGHEYPMAFGDARSVHFEVRVQNPELRIPLKPNALPPKGMGLLLHYPTEKPMAIVSAKSSVRSLGWDAEARTADNLVHFYSSSNGISQVESDVGDHAWMFVPLRFTTNAFSAYCIIVVALWLVAIFVDYIAVCAAAGYGFSTLLPQAITVSALVVTLGLWQLSTHPTGLIVGKKLWIFRTFATAASVSIVIGLIVLMISSAVRSGPAGASANCVSTTKAKGAGQGGALARFSMGRTHRNSP